MFRHRLLKLSLVTLLACSLILVTGVAPHAHASLTLLQCTGSHTSTYRPGLTNTNQTVTVTVSETLAPCVVPNTNIVSAGQTHSSTQVLSCAVSLVDAPLTFTYTWNTGQTSTVAYAINEVVQLADGTNQATATGTVIAGFGVGATAVRVFIIPETDVAACESASGLTQQSGPETVTFIL